MREEYSENVRRWYDKDPVLSRSMRTLEQSDDKTQIKVALNIIKIIIEHNIAYSEYSECGRERRCGVHGVTLHRSQ